MKILNQGEKRIFILKYGIKKIYFKIGNVAHQPTKQLTEIAEIWMFMVVDKVKDIPPNGRKLDTIFRLRVNWEKNVRDVAE